MERFPKRIDRSAAAPNACSDARNARIDASVPRPRETSAEMPNRSREKPASIRWRERIVRGKMSARPAFAAGRALEWFISHSRDRSAVSPAPGFLKQGNLPRSSPPPPSSGSPRAVEIRNRPRRLGLSRILDLQSPSGKFATGLRASRILAEPLPHIESSLEIGTRNGSPARCREIFPDLESAREGEKSRLEYRHARRLTATRANATCSFLCPQRSLLTGTSSVANCRFESGSRRTFNLAAVKHGELMSTQRMLFCARIHIRASSRIVCLFLLLLRFVPARLRTYLYGFARPAFDLVTFNYPDLHYSCPCCSEWFIALAGTAALPVVSREGYRVAHLAFIALQHPEMLGPRC